MIKTSEPRQYLLARVVGTLINCERIKLIENFYIYILIIVTAVAAVAASQAKYRHRTTAAAYKVQEIGVINVVDRCGLSRYALAAVCVPAGAPFKHVLSIENSSSATL